MSRSSRRKSSIEIGLLPPELFAEDSRAKILARREKVLESREKDQAYGLSTPDLLANYDRTTLSWKTLQPSLLEDWVKFSEAWPRSGTMRNGTAYRLPALVHHTDEIASGLLLTPIKIDASLAKSLRHDYSRSNEPGKQHWPGSLSEQMIVELGLRNTAQFSEMMMGYPNGWTEIASEPSEIPSFRKSQSLSAKQSSPQSARDFDPVLMETLIEWCCPPGGVVLDTQDNAIRAFVTRHLGCEYRTDPGDADFILATDPAPLAEFVSYLRCPHGYVVSIGERDAPAGLTLRHRTIYTAEDGTTSDILAFAREEAQ